jgi:hypothetical protein
VTGSLPAAARLSTSGRRRGELSDRPAWPTLAVVGVTVSGVTPTVAARALFATTAALVLVGMVVQWAVVVDATDGYFSTPAARVFNMFWYFTVQSNLIVGLTCLLLALNLDRSSELFRVFRIAGVVDIAITGVVYHVALADLQELDGRAAVADQLLHVVVPVVAVAGWLLCGPRGLVSRHTVVLAALVPIVWAVFTLIRGPIVDFYPYPFIDVRLHGYPRVVLNIALVGLLFVALGAATVWIDERLRGRSPGPA